jgi:hypothetical protein
MTEVQQSGGRARWFRRDNRQDAGGAHSGDAAPRGRWAGPGTRPDAETDEHAVDPAPDERTQIVRDPGVGERRRAAGREQLRDRFGGRKIGAAFFGWLVAVGMTVLLSAIATGIGLAVGSSMGLDAAGADAAPIGLAGAAVLLGVLAVAYFAGGYVAGRLARFDGARNGLLAWVVGLLVTVVAVVVGLVAGSANTGLFAPLRLPVLTGDPTSLTVAGVIALVAVLLVTAVAAALGGRVGEQFHRRVDRAAERL